MNQKIDKNFHAKKKKTIRYNDVPQILKRVEAEKPKKGDYLFDYKLKEIGNEKDKLDKNEFTRKYKINFRDLPISENTVNGLKKRKFIKLSEIQRCTIPHSLVGRDIMGASKTGSGKTLAYLIPVIERLYTQRWSEWDGLGALIILPTRELALQVFEVLNSISEYHELSVGLVIGGKNVEYEKEHITRMNILIATPGRLLQHMDETLGFSCQNLQLLVIDEADMLFELGFAETLNAILENLPPSRQTLLFSATLSKNVHQLGKLSLKEPEYVFLHDRNYSKNNQDGEQQEADTDKKTDIKNIYETPFKLMQYYMVMNIEDKLNSLFSFLKAHQKSKVLVFFSTCKQVRLAFEVFKKLKVGLPIMELHGRQKTNKRMALFYQFTEKKHAALFTTNVAARGLDFPAVNWVIQLDCPENTETYVHRIGRTARFKQDGKALIFLSQQEEKFVQRLKDKGINLHKLAQNPNKFLQITSTIQAFCSENMDWKYLAQRAFISYMRSIYLIGDDEIFDVHKIDYKKFAESLGLVQTPMISFKKREQQQEESESEEENNQQNESDSEMEQEQEGKQKLSKKEQKLELFKQKKQQEKEERKKKKENRIDIIHMKEDEQVQEQEKYKLKQQQKHTDKHTKLKNRKTNKFDQNIIVRQEDSDDDFLTKKKKSSIEIQQLDEETMKINKLHKLSKNQLKKIKMDGHYGGQNRQIITDDLDYITAEDRKKQEMEENLKRMQAEEDEIDYRTRYLINKEENEEVDKEINKKRLKEKHIKKKQKLREKEFGKLGGQVAVLGGGGDDDDYDNEEVD